MKMKMKNVLMMLPLVFSLTSCDTTTQKTENIVWKDDAQEIVIYIRDATESYKKGEPYDNLAYMEVAEDNTLYVKWGNTTAKLVDFPYIIFYNK